MADTVSIRCAGCEEIVSANVVAGRADPGNTAWLQCPSCGSGSVRSEYGGVAPSMPAGRLVAHLPEDVDLAWREVRTAHAVAAYTAAEIMCRKILMHLAVDKAGAKAGKSFAEYVDALDGAGFVAPGLKPVVDLIRTRGNGANHELPASSEAESVQTMKITEHLLETMYELPALAPGV